MSLLAQSKNSTGGGVPQSPLRENHAGPVELFIIAALLFLWLWLIVLFYRLYMRTFAMPVQQWYEYENLDLGVWGPAGQQQEDLSRSSTNRNNRNSSTEESRNNGRNKKETTAQNFYNVVLSALQRFRKTGQFSDTPANVQRVPVQQTLESEDLAGQEQGLSRSSTYPNDFASSMNETSNNGSEKNTYLCMSTYHVGSAEVHLIHH